MTNLSKYAALDIDWELGPAQAVTMYLEWGNNNWRGDHAPVRSKSDESIYFVVDAWEARPSIRLVRRNSEDAVDIVVFPMPEELLEGWRAEYGALKGVFEPSEPVKSWLKNAVAS